MYDYFHGEVAGRASDSIVLETGGIGYRFACSTTTVSKTPPTGPARLFAHLVVREDKHELYGFAEESERHLFRQLLLVSGVGPAVALGLLSAYEPALLASHIARGEVVHLTKVKGVGRRTAERIVVELRDRVAKEGGARPAAVTAAAGDAVLALCSLGLPRSEAERRVATVRTDGLELEEIVKQALRASP